MQLCIYLGQFHETTLTRLIVHRLVLNQKALWRRRTSTMKQRMVHPTPRHPQTCWLSVSKFFNLQSTTRHDQHIPDKFSVCMLVGELMLGLASPTPAHRQRGVNCSCAFTWPGHETTSTRLIVHRLLLNQKALWRRRARTMNQRMVQPTPRPPQTYW